MHSFDFLSDAAICGVLGVRLKTERLRKGLTQEEMSVASGVAVRTYKRLEANGRGSIETLVAVLRALDRLQILEAVMPKPSLPPQNTLIARFERVRKRVRHRPQ